MTQSSAAQDLPLIAYRLHPGPGPALIPAPRVRAWMAPTRGHAQRCLPLMIANQAGWLLLCERPVRATWSGGQDLPSLRVEALDGHDPCAASSHFGHGILTFSIPYLVRTPPGYNLLVRGPSNWPKDGVSALEGIVETDWAVATFTMNWKLTRPGTVVFEEGEPICMLLPVRRGELEQVQPALLPLSAAPELAAAHGRWGQSRSAFLTELPIPGSAAAAQVWQKDYFRGQSPGSAAAAPPEHQTRLHLRPFLEASAADPGEPAGGGIASWSEGQQRWVLRQTTSQPAGAE